MGTEHRFQQDKASIINKEENSRIWKLKESAFIHCTDHVISQPSIDIIPIWLPITLYNSELLSDTKYINHHVFRHADHENSISFFLSPNIVEIHVWYPMAELLLSYGTEGAIVSLSGELYYYSRWFYYHKGLLNPQECSGIRNFLIAIVNNMKQCLVISHSVQLVLCCE